MEIRKTPWYTNLPVVAMTANAMQDDRLRCQAAGMNDFVSKPIDPDDLWRALAKWIQPRAGLGQPPANQPQPSSAGSALEDDLPRHVPGLDTRVGLRHVMGKKALYLSLLRKFVSSQQAGLQPVVQALDAGDTAGAERLTHTLKGLAGNIGASTLQAAMEKLESALREQAPPAAVRSLLEPAANLLTALVRQLQAQLPAQTLQTDDVTVDPAQLQVICRQILALLTYDDPQAAEVLQSQASILESAFGESYRSIKAALDDYDFEVALQLFRAAAAQANITL
jgi:two-component system sensor histidine kinase/response regulator